MAAGLSPKRLGRPRKGETTSAEEYKYEIERLKIENKLLLYAYSICNRIINRKWSCPDREKIATPQTGRLV